MAEEKGASDLNLVERDPKGLNDSVQVGGWGKYSPYRHAEKLQKTGKNHSNSFSFATNVYNNKS